MHIQGVFFPRIIESLPSIPRKHSAVIGCIKNYQPIGETVHSDCLESFEGLLQRVFAVNCEKHNICRTPCTTYLLCAPTLLIFIIVGYLSGKRTLIYRSTVRSTKHKKDQHNGWNIKYYWKYIFPMAPSVWFVGPLVCSNFLIEW